MKTKKQHKLSKMILIVGGGGLIPVAFLSITNNNSQKYYEINNSYSRYADSDYVKQLIGSSNFSYTFNINKQFNYFLDRNDIFWGVNGVENLIDIKDYDNYLEKHINQFIYNEDQLNSGYFPFSMQITGKANIPNIDSSFQVPYQWNQTKGSDFQINLGKYDYRKRNRELNWRQKIIIDNSDVKNISNQILLWQMYQYMKENELIADSINLKLKINPKVQIKNKLPGDIYVKTAFAGSRDWESNHPNSKDYLLPYFKKNKTLIFNIESQNLNFNAKVKKWNGLEINSAIKLISSLNNLNVINHKQKLFNAFNVKNNSQKIILKSDTMGTLNSSIDKSIYINGKSNKEKLLEIIQTMNGEMTIPNSNLRLKYSYDMKVNKAGDAFDLIFKVKNIFKGDSDISNDFLSLINKEINGDYAFSSIENLSAKEKQFLFVNSHSDNSQKEDLRRLYYLFHNLLSENGIGVIQNIPVALSPSAIYDTYGENGFVSRLSFNYGKVVRDVSLWEIQNENWSVEHQFADDVPVKLKNKSGNYGGKWLVHSPLKVIFNTNKSESEILFINGKKIDVLNRVFEYDLKDLRDSANNSDDENDSDSETEPKAKNHYVVEIKKYRAGSNNNDEPVSTYKIEFVIVEQALNQNIKYFAWDPENNPKQKELITKYLSDENGNELRDQYGNKVLNPKYDPEINVKTGTKQQLVWIPQNALSEKITRTLKFWYPNMQNLNDYGIFANASVLGKGALRSLTIDENIKKTGLAETSYARIKLYDKAQNKWLSAEEQEWETFDVENAEGENAYISNEGIWLITAETEHTISNMELVLIDKNNSPYNYFLDEIDNKKDNENLSLSLHFTNFWESKLGTYFENWLRLAKSFNSEVINNLTYNEILPLYNEMVISSANVENLSQIDYAKDIFNDYEWSDFDNLNGLTDITEIENKVNEWLDFNLKNNLQTKNLIRNEDYVVLPLDSSLLNKQRFYENLAKVKLYTDEDFADYRGVKLLLKGKGKYANSEKEIYLKNTAWHEYNPPIDLSTLEINDYFEFELNKADFVEEGLFSWEIDKRYRDAVENKVRELIETELLNYQNKTRNEGKEIEIWLDKDVYIDKLASQITYLMRGKALDKTIEISLKGLNANLKNEKVLYFKNIGDGGKFNLQNLSYLLLDEKLSLKTIKIKEIQKQLVEFMKSKLESLNLILDSDLNIYMINYEPYWLDLIMDLNDEKLNDDEYAEIRSAIEKRKVYLEAHKTYRNIEIPFNTLNLDLNAKLSQQKQNILSLMRYESNLDLNKLNKYYHFWKQFILLPNSENVEDFGYGNIFNTVKITLNSSDDDRTIIDVIKDDEDNKKVIDEINNNDNNGDSEEDNNSHKIDEEIENEKAQRIKRNIWISVGVFFGIIASFGLGLGLYIWYKRKNGWTFGKANKRKLGSKKKK
ncbi:Mbov_0399 family ICE element protein [Mycoplasmopsis gallinarum]|uniref:Mbov_0399 family ICE element protein n=1 Tax=Mycoplasmopsis gallinarum TaxID=29557 RepID=UPI000480AEC6|nr:hypothetical protein [Mycoplasmopsis gallinarum]